MPPGKGSEGRQIKGVEKRQNTYPGRDGNLYNRYSSRSSETSRRSSFSINELPNSDRLSPYSRRRGGIDVHSGDAHSREHGNAIRDVIQEAHRRNNDNSSHMDIDEQPESLDQKIVADHGRLINAQRTVDAIQENLADSDKQLDNLAQHIDLHVKWQKTDLSDETIINVLHGLKKAISLQEQKVSSIIIIPTPEELRSEIKAVGVFSETHGLLAQVSVRDSLWQGVDNDKQGLVAKAKLLKEKINEAIGKIIGPLQAEEQAKLNRSVEIRGPAQENLNRYAHELDELGSLIDEHRTALTGNRDTSSDQIKEHKAKLEDTRKKLATLKTSIVSERVKVSLIRSTNQKFYDALRSDIGEIPDHFEQMGLLDTIGGLDTTWRVFDNSKKDLLAQAKSMIEFIEEAEKALQTAIQTYNASKQSQDNSQSNILEMITDTFKKLDI